jgi:hypothetical protein
LGRLVEVVNDVVLFKIYFVQMMGSFYCGAPIARKLIASLPQSSVMGKGKAVKTAVF